MIKWSATVESWAGSILSSASGQEQSLSGLRRCLSICITWKASPIALILLSDTGLHLNDPIQFSDKVKLITVSVPSSIHTITTEEAFDAFCFN